MMASERCGSQPAETDADDAGAGIDLAVLQITRQKHAGEPEEEDEQRRRDSVQHRGDEQQNADGEQRVERRERRARHAETQEKRGNGNRYELRHAPIFEWEPSRALWRGLIL